MRKPGKMKNNNVKIYYFLCFCVLQICNIDVVNLWFSMLLCYVCVDFTMTNAWENIDSFLQIIQVKLYNYCYNNYRNNWIYYPDLVVSCK